MKKYKPGDVCPICDGAGCTEEGDTCDLCNGEGYIDEMAADMLNEPSDDTD